MPNLKLKQEREREMESVLCSLQRIHCIAIGQEKENGIMNKE